MHAQLSRDLGECTEGLGDIDWVRAAGMSGRRHPVALAVWRLVELEDRRSLRAALNGTAALAVQMGLDEPVMAAGAVLQYLADMRCRACAGRGFRVIEGTPHLSDEACSACGGSGKRDPAFSADESRLYGAVRRLQREAAADVAARVR